MFSRLHVLFLLTLLRISIKEFFLPGLGGSLPPPGGPPGGGGGGGWRVSYLAYGVVRTVEHHKDTE